MATDGRKKIKGLGDQLSSALWVSEGCPESLSLWGELDDVDSPCTSPRLALRGHLGRTGLCADAAKILKQANAEPRTKLAPFLGSSSVSICSRFEKESEGNGEAKSCRILQECMSSLGLLGVTV